MSCRPGAHTAAAMVLPVRATDVCATICAESLTHTACTRSVHDEVTGADAVPRAVAVRPSGHILVIRTLSKPPSSAETPTAVYPRPHDADTDASWLRVVMEFAVVSSGAADAAARRANGSTAMVTTAVTVPAVSSARL